MGAPSVPERSLCRFPKDMMAAPSSTALGGGNSDREEMKPLHVNFAKRETEKDTRARLESYAHVRSKEENDVWITLEEIDDFNADDNRRVRMHGARGGDEGGP